jgi:hypothetical protein
MRVGVTTSIPPLRHDYSIGLETDSGQLHLLPVRPAGHLAFGSRSCLIDCRSGMRRFWTVTFPLLAPTGFFLLIINITYALFDTFGVIDIM